MPIKNAHFYLVSQTNSQWVFVFVPLHFQYCNYLIYFIAYFTHCSWWTEEKVWNECNAMKKHSQSRKFQIRDREKDRTNKKKTLTKKCARNPLIWKGIFHTFSVAHLFANFQWIVAFFGRFFHRNWQRSIYFWLNIKFQLNKSILSNHFNWEFLNIENWYGMTYWICGFILSCKCDKHFQLNAFKLERISIWTDFWRLHIWSTHSEIP